jgi:hypothetical protein
MKQKDKYLAMVAAAKSLGNTNISFGWLMAQQDKGTDSSALAQEREGN